MSGNHFPASIDDCEVNPSFKISLFQLISAYEPDHGLTCFHS
jgi:hypothetical protein